MKLNGSLLQSRRALPLLMSLVAPWSAFAQAAPPPETVPPAPLDRAMAHYERCEWVQAFDELALLADAGHRDAARMALLMRAHGSRLFGHSFAVGAVQRQRWLDAASAPASAE